MIVDTGAVATAGLGVALIADGATAIEHWSWEPVVTLKGIPVDLPMRCVRRPNYEEIAHCVAFTIRKMSLRRWRLAPSAGMLDE
jgi:hypothetical protein